MHVYIQENLLWRRVAKNIDGQKNRMFLKLKFKKKMVKDNASLKTKFSQAL